MKALSLTATVLVFTGKMVFGVAKALVLGVVYTTLFLVGGARSANRLVGG